ncbi:MAG: E3 binding domain-containing protein, partial [Stellaceae bacterium]
MRTPTVAFGPAEGPLGLKVSPLARRLAHEVGIDLAALAQRVR